MNKRVLVTSRSFARTSEKSIRILEDAGIEITNMGVSFRQEEFDRVIPEYDALIIGAHPFPPKQMARCSRLKIICKHGVGLDNIPLSQAEKLGIRVCNAPGTNSNAVADLTFALMLMTARKTFAAAEKVRSGHPEVTIGTDVYQKTLGLLGFGAIARCVARRARGFSMRVLAYDPYVAEVPEEFREFVTLTDMNTVLGQCDFLSIHMPLTDQTHHLIGKEELSRMRPGAILVDTARGGIVDEDALLRVLLDGGLAGAGMDVIEAEPVPPDHPLLRLDNVVITPHIGMYSREALDNVSLICAENVAACLNGGTLRHCVV